MNWPRELWNRYLILFFLPFQLSFAQLPPICFSQGTINTLPNSNFVDFVAEDFNGDGIPDIAASDVAFDRVVLFIGNGNGSFNTQSAPSFPTGGYPHNLVSEDFNSDGKPDLVTVNSTSNSISLLLGNGAGSFSPQVIFGVGNFPKALGHGDFNGDGNEDIVVGNYLGATISVLLGNGSGYFLNPLNYPCLQGIEAISCGDFNNDNKVDIAVAVWTSPFIKIYYGNGNGSFQPFVNFSMYTFDNYPYTMAAADFNNDNFDDLVVEDVASSKLTVLLSTSPTSMISYTVGSTSNNNNSDIIATGDINDDGNLDIVCPGNVFLLGTGSGSFVASTTYSAPISNCALIKDFNLDGKPDLGLISQSLFTALYSPVVQISSLPSFICPGHQQTLTVSGASSYSWSSNQTGSSIIVNPAVTTTYSVVATNSIGCSNSAAITLSVVNNPDSLALSSIQIQSPYPDTTCSGAMFNLCVTGASSFTWSTGSNAACINPSPNSSTIYSVTAMGLNGCLKSMSHVQTVVECLGKMENSQESVEKLPFPNPSSGTCLLPFSISNKSQITIELISTEGVKVKEILNETLEPGNYSADFSVEDLAAGCYFLLINKQGRTSSSKILVK